MRVATYMYERDQFVVALARVFETRLFLARDALVSRGLSVNDVMFSVTMGKIAIWGRNTVNPILDFKIKRVHDTVGDDICMLFDGKHAKQVRHYSARAVTAAQVYALDGVLFSEAVSGFDVFHKAIKSFGCWQLFRDELLKAARDARAADARAVDARRRDRGDAEGDDAKAVLAEARATVQRLSHRLLDATHDVFARDTPPPRTWRRLVEPLRALDRAFAALDRGDDWSFVPKGKHHSDLDCEPPDVEHITASGIARDEPSCSAGDLGTCGVAVDLRALPHC